MVVLDHRDARPLYLQVKDSLRRMMLTGLLAPGEKLPSVRALATQLAINPNTIQRAYGELETEGYVYSVSGRGSFVAGTDSGQAQRIRELTAAGVGEDTRGRIRIRRLEEMAKENRDLAALLEHYYERGYLKNERYTL